MRTFILLILILTPGALGAQISGTAYTENLQPAQYATLTINTTPQQRIVLTNGTYNITVPKGSYLLRAAYKSGQRQYEDAIVATVVDQGTYVYDLILFRTNDNNTEAELPDLEDLSVPDTPQSQESNSGVRTALLILLLLGLVSGAVFLSGRQWWHRKKKVDAHQKSQPPIGEDLQQILTFLRQEGGRATQKELRRVIPCSEAKMSMMLADLENQGLIRRIRKGRANVIVLV